MAATRPQRRRLPIVLWVLIALVVFTTVMAWYAMTHVDSTRHRLPPVLTRAAVHSPPRNNDDVARAPNGRAAHVEATAPTPTTRATLLPGHTHFEAYRDYNATTKARHSACFAVAISNEEFVDGAMVLAWTLRQHSPMAASGAAGLIAIVPRGGLCADSLERMRLSGWTEVLEVEDLAAEAPHAHWANTFNKLYLFNLTQCRRVAFFDADMLIRMNPDRIFKTHGLDDSGEIVGALGNSPFDRHGKPRAPYFQTGMMVLTPAAHVFDAMMHDFRTDPVHKSVNGRDGALIRSYFGAHYVNIDDAYSVHSDPRDEIGWVTGVHYRGDFKPWFNVLEHLEDPEEAKRKHHHRHHHDDDKESNDESKKKGKRAGSWLEIGPGYALWWHAYENLHRHVLAPRDRKRYFDTAAADTFRPLDEPHGYPEAFTARGGYVPEKHMWLQRHSAKQYVQLTSSAKAEDAYRLALDRTHELAQAAAEGNAGRVAIPAADAVAHLQTALVTGPAGVDCTQTCELYASTSGRGAVPDGAKPGDVYAARAAMPVPWFCTDEGMRTSRLIQSCEVLRTVKGCGPDRCFDSEVAHPAQPIAGECHVNSLLDPLNMPSCGARPERPTQSRVCLCWGSFGVTRAHSEGVNVSRSAGALAMTSSTTAAEAIVAATLTTSSKGEDAFDADLEAARRDEAALRHEGNHHHHHHHAAADADAKKKKQKDNQPSSEAVPRRRKVGGVHGKHHHGRDPIPSAESTRAADVSLGAADADATSVAEAQPLGPARLTKGVMCRLDPKRPAVSALSCGQFLKDLSNVRRITLVVGDVIAGAHVDGSKNAINGETLEVVLHVTYREGTQALAVVYNPSTPTPLAHAMATEWVADRAAGAELIPTTTAVMWPVSAIAQQLVPAPFGHSTETAAAERRLKELTVGTGDSALVAVLLRHMPNGDALHVAHTPAMIQHVLSSSAVDLALPARAAVLESLVRSAASLVLRDAADVAASLPQGHDQPTNPPLLALHTEFARCGFVRSAVQVSPMPLIDAVPLVGAFGDPRCGAASGGKRKPQAAKSKSGTVASATSLLLAEAAVALKDPQHLKDQHPAVCGSFFTGAHAAAESSRYAGIARLADALSDWGEKQTLTRAFDSFFATGGANGDSKRTLKLRQQLALQTWDPRAAAALLKGAAARLEAPMTQLGVALRMCVIA